MVYEELGSFGRRGRRLSAARLESVAPVLLRLLARMPAGEVFDPRLVAARAEVALNASIKALDDPVDRRIAEAMFAARPEFFDKTVAQRRAYETLHEMGFTEEQYRTRRARVLGDVTDSLIGFMDHQAVGDSLPQIAQPQGLWPGDHAEFLGDVTYPDGWVVQPHQSILKTWRVRNAGTVQWRDRRLMRQTPDAPSLPTCALYTSIPDADPGAVIDISVELMTGWEEATAWIEFKMVDAYGCLIYPDRYAIGLGLLITTRKNRRYINPATWYPRAD